MPLIYISADGNWGAAEDLKIIHVTDEEIDELNDMGDGEVQEFAGKKNPEPEPLVIIDDGESFEYGVEDVYDIGYIIDESNDYDLEHLKKVRRRIVEWNGEDVSWVSQLDEIIKKREEAERVAQQELAFERQIIEEGR
jgi:hypothetical protein